MMAVIALVCGLMGAAQGTGPLGQMVLQTGSTVLVLAERPSWGVVSFRDVASGVDKALPRPSLLQQVDREVNGHSYGYCSEVDLGCRGQAHGITRQS